MLQSILLLSLPGLPEILGIGLILLLIFGGKKIPELMRGLGKGINEFKKGVKDIEEEVKKDPEKSEIIDK
ncbi:MAG TPA: twin-arginine translocase TatA/TatE family subunit [Paludibacter sp.]|nr:twin-arginine translocase TatA/TatE family subunit [Paludibacter sp.]